MNETKTSALLNLRVSEKRYGTRAVLQGFQLQLEPGDIVSLIGASGCGKSSLLSIAAGLDPHYRGSLRLRGQAISGPNPEIGLIFQEPRLFPWLTVAQNIAFGAPASRIDGARIAALLEEVGLAGYGDALPKQLSGGQAQRVALARALARQPELLFADEPFSALDAITRAEMQALLVDLVHRWHTAALLVTHDIDEAILVADRILLMAGQPGRIVREWKVDLPRPRHEHAEGVVELRLDIIKALRDGA